jgi:ABC-type lipoprotein export system ATPase subunit
MPLIELSDYILPSYGSGYGIHQFYFALSKGDVCAIEATHPDDATLFLKALATLIRPLKGIFRYAGREKDLGNYRNLLDYKQRVGYIAPDTALISNMTLRQNLLIRRYYFENSLSDHLDDKTRDLCSAFNILDKLDRRPTALNAMEVQAAIVIRETMKKPEILLLNRPEDFIGHTNIEILGQMFNDWVTNRLPVVVISYDKRFIRRFANRKVLITNGSLTTVAVKQPAQKKNEDTNNDRPGPPEKE